jgi:NAD-dependent SIR2 family protein deacetylase
LLRPNVLWFDESYQEKFYSAQSAAGKIAESDVLIVVGTTLQTSLPLKMVHEAASKGIIIIEINPKPFLDFEGVLRLEGLCEDLVPALLVKYKENILTKK